MGFENIFRVEAGRLVSDIGSLPMGYSTESKMLAWRPGGVVVGDGPHKARVLASSFAGGHREYVLESQLGPIKADAPIESAEVALGDPVVFDLPQATARPLAP